MRAPDMVRLCPVMLVVVGMNFFLRWLAAHLPARKCSRKSPDELVTVGNFATTTEAELWKGRMQSQGVRCILIGEAHGPYINPIVREEFGGVQLQVRAGDADRALRVLRGSG